MIAIKVVVGKKWFGTNEIICLCDTKSPIKHFQLSTFAAISAYQVDSNFG